MCCQADLLITYIKYEWKWLSSFRSRFLSFTDFDFIIVVLPVIERLFVLIKTCEQGSSRFTHSRFRLRPVPHFWRFIYSRLSQFSIFFFNAEMREMWKILTRSQFVLKICLHPIKIQIWGRLSVSSDLCTSFIDDEYFFASFILNNLLSLLNVFFA